MRHESSPRSAARALVLAAILHVPSAAGADDVSAEDRAYCERQRRIRSGPSPEDRERCRVIWEEADRERERERTEGGGG
jgi:hypothetical protein